MKKCNFKIGDEVVHSPDLFGECESVVRAITRGFRLGDGPQFLEDSIRQMENARVEKVDGEDCLVFVEHQGTKLNQIWDDKKQRFNSISVPATIPREVLPFYGYTISTTNEKVNTLYPERALTLKPQS